MRIKTVLILFFLSLVICPCLQSQTVTNIFNPPQVQADVVKTQQINECPKFGMLYSSTAIVALGLTPPPAHAPDLPQQITNKEGHVISSKDAAELKAQGWTDQEIANAIPVPSITNQYGNVIPPEDVAFFRSKGYTDAEIAGQYQPPAAPIQQQDTLSPTPPDLKNAFVFVDDFLGGGKTGFPADVISFKKSALKFRVGGKDFDYSGNFSILLNTPRKHRNPYFGLGSPETVKLLILEDFLKGESDGTVPLQNATIWEKSDGYIVATAAGKEWIHFGTYSIQN